MIWVVVGLAVVAVAVVLLVVAARRRRPDGVTTFQRQIDALSPDARRSVVRSVAALDRKKPRPQVEREGIGPDQRATSDESGPRRRSRIVGDPLGGGPRREPDETGANDGA